MSAIGTNSDDKSLMDTDTCGYKKRILSRY